MSEYKNYEKTRCSLFLEKSGCFLPCDTEGRIILDRTLLGYINKELEHWKSRLYTGSYTFRYTVEVRSNPNISFNGHEHIFNPVSRSFKKVWQRISFLNRRRILILEGVHRCATCGFEYKLVISQPAEKKGVKHPVIHSYFAE